MHVHNGLRFDTWTFLNNLTCERKLCNFIKTGKDIISIKKFKSFVFNDKSQAILRNVHFRWGMTHVNYSFKKL